MRITHMLIMSVILAQLICSATVALAQRVSSNDQDHVIYYDASHRQRDLGVGFNPSIIPGVKVLITRGIEPVYGVDFDCNDRTERNWVTIYDPATSKEQTLWDEPVHYPDFDMEGGWCVFTYAQLSPDGKTLFLVIPIYATSSKLAIIRLADKMTTFVSADMVFPIEDGPHRGELILVGRRLKKESDGLTYPYDPFIHAHSDGREIKVLSEEYVELLNHEHAPILAGYLKRLGGHIRVNGERFP